MGSYEIFEYDTVIERILDEFCPSEDDYKKLSKLLLSEMEQGLGKATHASSIVKMFPTYVRHVPDGTERGHYLALDLGGTNFRVLLITLHGSKEPEMKNTIYSISEETMTGPGEQLFDHIAACIHEFMSEHNLLDKPIPLGFTFSFPCKQEGLNVGRLVTWTKGFSCPGVEGEDVVELLHKAIERRGDLNGVECVALLNDTVGCLMSCAFTAHNTEIGVILGTGTNACYMENLDHVGTWDGDQENPRQVIINTEWGAFGDNGCIDFLRTDIDKRVDTESINPNKQTYEKMISGMYMGEIVRQVILRCVNAGHLFDGNSSEALEEPHAFHTKYVSEIEEDTPQEGFIRTKKILEELGLLEDEDYKEKDLHTVQDICATISKRAAYLASAGVATLLNRINKPDVTVSVDGSLFRYHPHFKHHMQRKIREMIRPGIKFELMLSEDGSGKGAAMVAAVSYRLKHPQS